jgi:hypothetical protein
VTDESVELYFAIPAPTADLREDVEDICFELDVLLDGHTVITPVVCAGVDGFDWSDGSLRGVYSAKPPKATKMPGPAVGVPGIRHLDR